MIGEGTAGRRSAGVRPGSSQTRAVQRWLVRQNRFVVVVYRDQAPIRLLGHADAPVTVLIVGGAKTFCQLETPRARRDGIGNVVVHVGALQEQPVLRTYHVDVAHRAVSVGVGSRCLLVDQIAAVELPGTHERRFSEAWPGVYVEGIPRVGAGNLYGDESCKGEQGAHPKPPGCDMLDCAAGRTPPG